MSQKYVFQERRSTWTSSSPVFRGDLLTFSLIFALFFRFSVTGALLLPASPSDHIRGRLHAPKERFLPQHLVDHHVRRAGDAGVDVHHRLSHLPRWQDGEHCC